MSDASLLPDPSARLSEAYRRVGVRMRGLNFLNPALEVEAVAFAPWEGRWLGVVVTPWSINLALAPRDPDAWPALRKGDKRRYRFPAGEFEFIGATDDEVGELQVCSLFSPVLEFEDHPSARLVATLAREALFDPAHADATDPRDGLALSPPGPVARLAEGAGAPMSRRDLLRGRIGRPRDDDRG